MEVCLEYYEHEFMELVTACPAVVCCRCSPEQKAQVVRLIQQHTGKRTAAIGKLNILFLSNHNIHKSWFGLCFWASDTLIERFYLNLSIIGSEVQNERP